MDDVIGRLFSYLDTAGLMDSTYVFMVGDNGAALLDAEGTTGNSKVSWRAPCMGQRTRPCRAL